MDVAFPGESAEYRAARNRLLEQEIELRRATEAVAAARRHLPPGGVVPEDYVFHGQGPDGSPAEVRLSELFAPGKDSLVIYSMMFPRARDDDSPGPQAGRTALLPLAEGPCPSCTALLDQLEGAAEHAAQRVNLAVAAKAPIERVLTFAAERGWRRLRMLSSAGTTYNRDYLAEAPNGDQRPMLNVFHRDGDTIRHFWCSELFYASADPGEDPRHVGTIEPLWNLFDFTPEGRGSDWYEQLSYATESHGQLPGSGVLGNGWRPAGSPDEAEGVTCGVGVYAWAVELYCAECQDPRARGRDVLDHDVEVICCGVAGSGQVGGWFPGARWNARPEEASLAATTAQSSSRYVTPQPEQRGVERGEGGRVRAVQDDMVHAPDHAADHVRYGAGTVPGDGTAWLNELRVR